MARKLVHSVVIIGYIILGFLLLSALTWLFNNLLAEVLV